MTSYDSWLQIQLYDLLFVCFFECFSRNTAKDPFESVESKHSLSGITVCYKETQNDKFLELIWYVHLEILTSECRVAVKWGYRPS